MRFLFVVLLVLCIIYAVHSAKAPKRKDKINTKSNGKGNGKGHNIKGGKVNQGQSISNKRGCDEIQYNLGKMKLGETRNVRGSCVEVSCRKNGAITYHSCGEPVSPNCDTIKPSKKDLKKNYPRCCPKFLCA